MESGMSADPAWESGRCLCGAVVYRIRRPLRPAHACHCGQCRRQSGHFVVATMALPEDFELIEERGLRWYASSEWARRGFCGDCGSAMFWTDDSEISIAAGSLDDQSAVEVTRHIFYDEKPGFYDVADGLPKFAQYEEPMDEKG